MSDRGNNVIRKLTIATGQLSTFVGELQSPGSTVLPHSPGPLWGDGTSLYVIDELRIYKVDLQTKEVADRKNNR